MERQLELDAGLYQKIIAIATSFGSDIAAMSEEFEAEEATRASFTIIGAENTTEKTKVLSKKRPLTTKDSGVTREAYQALMNMLWLAWANDGVERTLTISPSGENKLTITVSELPYNHLES